MTDPTANSQGALERQRHRALRGFAVHRLASGFAGRTAFALGIAIAVGFAAWMTALYLTSRVDAADVLLVRGVGWLSVVAGGLATWGLACDLRERDAKEGITALLHQRGFEDAQVQRAYYYATGRLIIGTLLGPAAALALLGVALSRSVDVFLGRLLLTAGIAGYVIVVGGVLALCARWSVAVERRHARWLLVGILAGPDLARSAGASVPSVASLLGELLDQVARLGVAFL